MTGLVMVGAALLVSFAAAFVLQKAALEALFRALEGERRTSRD
ncbi:MAG TPA: hypothetical protein VG672_25605 [Bryobacteraceae bacterium]|jgi:hypothetical protein|nr:hypothetical protein [Bryobacteraceae bacterium]